MDEQVFRTKTISTNHFECKMCARQILMISKCVSKSQEVWNIFVWVFHGVFLLISIIFLFNSINYFTKRSCEMNSAKRNIILAPNKSLCKMFSNCQFESWVLIHGASEIKERSEVQREAVLRLTSAWLRLQFETCMEWNNKDMDAKTIGKVGGIPRVKYLQYLTTVFNYFLNLTQCCQNRYT